jgi:hypothetical protein
MELRYELNSDCLKLHPKVEKLFIYDNDDVDALIYELIKVNLVKTIGMKTLEKHTFQITYYTMPNGKIFAVAYASNMEVKFDKAEKEIKKFFENIPSHTNCYLFYLALLENGYTKK